MANPRTTEIKHDDGTSPAAQRQLRADRPQPYIEFRNVFKAFGTHVVLDDVSFDVLPGELSTGMKRSVAIARALAAQPEAILYDEPTTQVDPLMAQLLGDLIQKLKYQLKLTSIVVTHDMRLAQKLADRVVFLHEGKAIFFGRLSEWERSDHPVLQEFLKLDELRLPEEPSAPAAV